MAKLQPTPSEIRAKKESVAYHKKIGQKPNKRKEKIRCLKKAKLETYAELRKMKYHVYLKSKYWKQVREVVLKRDKNACVICQSTYRLQVHHDNYKHIANELRHLEDVMTLCDKCHREHHYAQP